MVMALGNSSKKSFEPIEPCLTTVPSASAAAFRISPFLTFCFAIHRRLFRLTEHRAYHIGAQQTRNKLQRFYSPAVHPHCTG
jgi:hypothetical protein